MTRVLALFTEWRFHPAELGRRIRYYWLGRTLLLVVAFLVFCVVPALVRGKAPLLVNAPAGAAVTLDGQPWNGDPVRAGIHTITATMPDGRTSWASVTMQANHPLTLTLPVGLPAPQIRQLQPMAPGMLIERIWWGDGGWRVRSRPIPILSKDPSEPTPTPGPGQTMAMRPTTTERLSTIDAFAGIADQLHQGDRLLEALYRPHGRRSNEPGTGEIEIRGWGAGTVTIPVSSPLALLQFAPAGDALLMVEQVETGGEEASLLHPSGALDPLIAVPGTIRHIDWRPDGTALVLTSVSDDQLSLTLIRLTPTIAAATVAALDARAHAGDLVPLIWTKAGVQWVAPDEQETLARWRAPLTTLIPERVDDMPARGMTELPDGTLRILAVLHEQQVVIARVEGDLLVVEAALPSIPPSPDLMGLWRGNQLLIQGSGRAWIVQLAP